MHDDDPDLHLGPPRGDEWTVAHAGQPGDFLAAARHAVDASSVDERLRAVALLRDRLPEIEADAVFQAVAAGASWARIAAALGRSRQAVHAKYAVRPPRKAPASRRRMNERAEAVWAQVWLAEFERRRSRR